MHRLTCALIAAVLMVATGRRCLSGEPAAAELAAEIDRQIDARLDAEGVARAEAAGDAEFLRRVYLDLHGVVPTADQAKRFLDDPDPGRRARLIDALLAARRYGEFLADVWQGYLVSPLADDRRARAGRLRTWLAEQFNTRPWDRTAYDVLTATGKIDENPPAACFVEGRLPRTVPDLTDLTSRYFLGTRLNCAQCHDHPSAPWTRQDFWGMAAFFAPVQTPGRPKQVYQLGVRDDPAVTLASLATDATPDGFVDRPPAFLGGGGLPAGAAAGRAALAAWVTSPENPYFARAMVNRTWWRLFGRGIVHPVDDMHGANAASHPELLDLLSRRFAESGFDLKFLTGAIVLSRAYQRTSRGGDAFDKQTALFGRMSVKVLSAGQLYDSLAAAFGPPEKARGGTGASDARDEFVRLFADDGDPDPTAYRQGIPHALRRMNSGQFVGRGAAEVVTRAAGRTPDEAAEELFLAILARRPTAEESRLFRDHLAGSASPEAACRELAWALMMSSEFCLNH